MQPEVNYYVLVPGAEPHNEQTLVVYTGQVNNNRKCLSFLGNCLEMQIVCMYDVHILAVYKLCTPYIFPVNFCTALCQGQIKCPGWCEADHEVTGRSSATLVCDIPKRHRVS